MSKALRKHFAMYTKPIGNKLFLQRRFLTIKMQEGEDLLVHINMVKALVD
jgi:hypothetical protein